MLATGRCTVTGTDLVAGREAILLECDHPRAIEVAADRPDFQISIAVDRQLGVILRLVETIGGRTTRDAEVTDIGPGRAPAARRLRLRLPHRDDDALLTGRSFRAVEWRV